MPYNNVCYQIALDHNLHSVRFFGPGVPGASILPPFPRIA